MSTSPLFTFCEHAETWRRDSQSESDLEEATKPLKVLFRKTALDKGGSEHMRSEVSSWHPASVPLNKGSHPVHFQQTVKLETKSSLGINKKPESASGNEFTVLVNITVGCIV